MQWVTEFKEIPIEHEQNSFMILIGNGKTEKRIIPKLCPHFNGNNLFIWNPSKPILNPPGMGFKILEKIKTHISYHKKFIIVVDKEHLYGNKLDVYLKGKLKEVKIKMNSKLKLTEEGIFIEGRLMGMEIIIYIIVMGTTKFIEECLSELIYLEMNIRLPPNKKIWKEISRQNIDINHLFRNADINNIKNSFPNLSACFEHIETNI